jgi:hypothetical protein
LVNLQFEQICHARAEREATERAPEFEVHQAEEVVGEVAVGRLDDGALVDEHGRGTGVEFMKPDFGL